MDQSISIFFEGIRNGFLDAFFLLITEFGDELVFLIISSILYWTVNKRIGYQFMMIFLGTIAVNDFLKFLIARPRPFQAGVVEVVGEGSYGYSMPSGHAQGSMTMALTLDQNYRRKGKWVSPVLFTIAILVSISRIYLGQHYLSDVLVGMAVAFAVFYAIRYVGPKLNMMPQKFVYIIAPVLIVGLFFIEEKNFFVATAAMLALSIGYDLERRYVQYDINRPLVTKIIAYVIGLIIALALKEGLKIVLPYTTDLDSEMVSLDYWLDFIRYFILCLWLSLGSFALFKVIFKQKSA